MELRRFVPNSAAALLAALSLQAASCGPDEASKYTLAITSNVYTLTADGSDQAVLRVIVLDQDANPPPIGSVVTMQAQNGRVNLGTTDTGTSETDAVGAAEFTVQCSGTSNVSVAALYDGKFGALDAQIDCQPAPTGDWRVIVGASPRSLRPLESTTVTITAVDGAGAPVPSGTLLRAYIDEPNPGAAFRTGGTNIRVATSDASGSVTLGATAPSSNGSFSICAEFLDQRFGAGSRCVTISVSDRALSSGCTGVVAPDAIPADGESTATLTFSVFDAAGQPVSDAEVFAVVEGTGEILEDPEDLFSGTDELSLFTDTSGQAETRVLAPTTTGTADIVATVTYVDSDGETVEDDCEVEPLVFFPPPVCQFDPIPTLSPGETTAVRVCFSNPAGRNIAPLTPVKFRIATSSAPAVLTATTALISGTDANGDGAADDPCVTTGLAAGATSGTLELAAEIEYGASTAGCQSGPVSITGGGATARQITASCSSGAVGAYLDRLGDQVLSACDIVCTAHVIDVFNNPVQGAEVVFTTEAGSIGGVGTTGADGFVSVPFWVAGSPPQDVTPIGAEPSVTGVDGTVNPRDALVTIIAMTSGMEDFRDENGNGRYDAGEIFVDIGEPFVDADDSGDFNEGTHEAFRDVAFAGRPANGSWDAPNEVWDSNTTIWTTTHVLYVGPWAGSLADFRFRPAGSSTEVPVSTPRLTSPGTLIWRPRDANGNSLPRFATFSVANTCSVVETESTEDDSGGRFGVFSPEQIEQYYSGGVPVGGEQGGIDFSRWIPNFRFGLTGPGGFFSIGPVGVREECTMTVSVSQIVDPLCADGGGLVQSTAFTIAIP
ncbi:MAG: hypothetical protein H6698_00050 [Myxococcales bacterium]|nr:hypothetical protein [Myxococcales bacterium]MCB9520559.1 hypothetical protein [Myxococcales bacterium]MCB9532602.1 hypothetical protein [Myxococcales bacterium]MCB9532703.1 hypothetical protein [Myxococcales bacterium]